MSKFKRTTMFAVLAALMAASAFAANRDAALNTTLAAASDTNDRQVNTTAATGSLQSSPAIARDADGDTVVVWQGPPAAGQADNIYLRRLNFFGVVQGTADVLVNTTTANAQTNPAVANDASGNFVVVWESDLQDDSATTPSKGIYAQRHNAAGMAQGMEFRVNTFTAEIQSSPAVAMNASGSFVVVWESRTQDGSGFGIYGQRYDAAGAALGAEFRVNTTTANSQRFPSVAMDLAGNFVVAWQSNGQDGDANGIIARRYMADGTAVAGEFIVNSLTAGEQLAPVVASHPNGAFLVAWAGPDASGTGIYSRRYDNAGQALDTSDVAVNTSTAGAQSAPALTLNTIGDVLVAWESDGQDGSGFGIYYRRYDVDGTAVTTELRANNSTANGQRLPAAAMDADGDYVIIWQDNNVGATDAEIRLRRFSGPEEVDMAISKADSTDPVNTQGAFNYTLTVTNNHFVTSDVAIGGATNLVVVDTLPGGVTINGSATGTNWTCATAMQTVTCTYGTNAAPLSFSAGMSSTITIPVTVGATAPANNQVSNSASASADQADDTAANNTDTETTNICGANDDAGEFLISSVNGSVNEGATATITVTRRTPAPFQTLCGPATVRYATANGTATATTMMAAGDYESATGTLSFPDSTAAAPGAAADMQTMTFMVPANSDTLDENDETVNLGISQQSSGAIAMGGGSGTLTLTDQNTPPVATLTTAMPTTVDEAVGSKTLTVTLSGVSGRTVTVPYTFSGTAVAADYSASPAAMVSIPAGETEATITLNITDDARDEADETIVTTLTAASGTNPSYFVGTPGNQTITITDNDPLPTLSVSNSSLPEGTTGTGANDMTFTVTLSQASNRQVTVNCATANGTAIAGSDYTAGCTPATVTINAGLTSATFTVAITRDATDEDDEVFVVNLTGASNATPASLTATGTINDDDAAPTVTLGAPSNATPGETGSVTLAATLSAASGKTVRAAYGFTGTATAGQDFTSSIPAPSTGTDFVFSPGTTSATLTLTISVDALDEADETVITSLGALTNATVGANPSRTVTITDDDPTPTLRFDPNSLSASEADGMVTATAMLSAISGRDVTVPYTVSGSASPGSDFSLAPTSPLTIPAGSQTGSITVSLSNDSVQENNETVTLTLGNAANATTAANPQNIFTLTINDDDANPQVFFGSASQLTTEGNGTITIPVRLSRTADDDITLAYGLSGSANQPADYSISPASPLTIPAGTPASGITLSVSLVADAIAETDETIIVTLANATNATIASPNAHTVTVRDGNSAGVIIAESGGNTNVTEGGATDSYTVKLNSQPSTDVTITVTGSAQASASPATLTFTSANFAVEQAVTVTAVNDNTAEGAHMTSVTMSASSPDPLYNGIAVNPVVVNITDNEVAGIAVTESNGGTLLTEGGATDSYTLVLTSEPSADVTFSVMPNAQVTTDKASITFTNANWNVAQTVTVTAVNDAVAEGTHSGIVMHGTPSSMDAAYNVSGAAARNVTAQITDNDSARLVFSKMTASVTEGGATDTYMVKLNSEPTANVTVSLDAGSQLRVATGGGAAAQMATLTFTNLAGMAGGWNVDQVVTLSALDDAINETSPHSGMVTHAAESTDAMYTIASAGNVTASITDNDAVPTLSISDASVAEGDTTNTNLSFTISLSSASGQTVTVRADTSNGTATAGSDYTATGSTATIPAGMTSVTLLVPVTGDVIDEDNETLTVTLSAPTNATIADATGAGTITDDDAPPVVSVAGATVTEGDSGTANLVFRVSLSALSGKPVTVMAATSNGTATAGSDYTANTETVMIPAGANGADFTVQVMGDATDEVNETLTVTLSAPSNATLAATPTATGTITDDDGAPSLSIDSTVVVVEGNSATATGSFTVTLAPASGQTVTVAFASANGTATAGSDYVATSGTLTFAPGETTKTIPVTVNGDTVDEADETLTVSLSNPGNAALSANNSGTLTITDDDVQGLSIGDAMVTEGNAGTRAMTFTVSIPMATSGPVSVTASTGGGTATAGADYVAKTEVLSIAAGQTTVSFVVTVNGDQAVEGNETFMVTLSNPSNATLNDGTAIGTITDDDTAGVQITQTSGSTQVTEGGTTDSYSIALSSQPASNVTVNLSVGNQISLSAATLTFTPANFSTAQTVTVTAVDDNQVEGTHSASISTAVSSADAAYNNASVPDLSVSIADNDAVAEPVVVTPGGSGGGSLGWLLLLPLAAAGLRRRSTASTESGN